MDPLAFKPVVAPTPAAGRSSVIKSTDGRNRLFLRGLHGRFLLTGDAGILSGAARPLSPAYSAAAYSAAAWNASACSCVSYSSEMSLFV
jgi:hypothetical protein